MSTSLLHIAIKAAIEAGAAIMDIYNTNFEVAVKKDDSPITLADETANSIINSYLEKTEIPIISEENREQPYEEREHWETCWIVDPLDGTKEFVKHNGDFTVNIALLRERKPYLGVIYIPVTQTLYFTSEDAQNTLKYVLEDLMLPVSQIIAGALIIRPSKSVEPIHILASRSHLNQETEDYISKIKQGSEVAIVHRGSSLKFCSIAEGEGHVYPRFAPTMEWDTAAGHAICKAVGVEVIDQVTLKPLAYNKEILLNPNFVVSVL